MTTILVVEDQEPLREEILEILSLEEFQVIGAENGQIGVILAREQKPDLILCDVMMPELDGHAVLNLLRQDPSTATIPFIFLTAKADKTDFRRGMSLGADDYLTKPFTRSELLDAIATQCSKRAAIEYQSQRRLDELRSNITLSLPHELHTPLAGIIGMSELLIEGYGSLEKTEALEMLEAIHESAELLYRLTQNFLLYAELEITAANPSRVAALRENSVRSHATALIEDVAFYTAEKVDRIPDLHLNLQDFTVLISEHKLKKIIEEVVGNAFKFSPAGTLVQVIGKSDDVNFYLDVINQGRGFSPEHVANIGAYMQFERHLYEQQGSGLGLVIAKRLVELHGGELAIDSIPHQQTTVRITLPA